MKTYKLKLNDRELSLILAVLPFETDEEITLGKKLKSQLKKQEYFSRVFESMESWGVKTV